MKKICFVTTVSITLKAFVLKTAEYLHENTDWDISFVCNNDDEFLASLPDYFHYYPIPMERGISSSGIKATIEMKRLFMREKFDLVQYSTPNASFYAAIASKLAGVPIRLYCQWGIAYVGFSGLKRRIFKTIEKAVCSLSTWIEPDSNSNLEFSHSEGLYPDKKGSVVWNGSACGVDLLKFDFSKKDEYRDAVREKFGIQKDAFVFGFVGRITRDKGINELLTAFHTICTGSEYLLLVGPDEADATVDANLMIWAKNNNNVLFTGYTDTVEQYLSAMDCYILPSYREGFGMGVIEAEAMGLPVIVTNIPGPIDGMKDNETGLIIEKNNIYDLVKAMKKVQTDTLFATLCGEHGVKYSKENFDQNVFFSKILEDRRRLLKEYAY